MTSYKNNIIGVAVFGYNRPKKLELILSKILEHKSKSSLKFKVRVFIDGLKKNEDKIILQKNLLLKKKFKMFEFKISKFNKGLQKSILAGLDEISKDFKYFLVFEDDILILSNFDNLINAAIKKKMLKKYSTLSFYCPFGINLRNFFNKLSLIETYRMHCWGWFTSSRNWKHFRSNSSNKFLKKIKKEEYIKKIGEDDYKRLLSTIYHKKDIWACRWIAYNFMIKKPTLIPSISFIKNIGTGDAGTNKTSSLSKYRESLNKSITYLRLKFIRILSPEIRKISKIELEIITNRRKIF